MKKTIPLLPSVVCAIIVFLASNPVARAQLSGHDDAGAYTTGANNSAWLFNTTSNGGFGFGSWTFRSTGTTSSNFTGFFVGDPGNIGVSNKAWGMYANGSMA